MTCEKILFSLGEAPVIPKEKTKVISNELYALTVNITGETLSLFNEAKNLSRCQSNEDFLKKVSQETIDKIKKKKFHLNNQQATSSQSPRFVTANLKKVVYLRVKGKCHLCGIVLNLQFDHRMPFALTGETSKENLRLLCFNCNQRSRIRAGL